MGVWAVDAHLHGHAGVCSVRPNDSLLPTDRHCAHQSQRAMPYAMRYLLRIFSTMAVVELFSTSPSTRTSPP
ncbi:hypothetical protein PSOLE_23000 [Pseudomonas oleovorans subsp. oleovorans]|uniref:Uncharacterized protein n=1 Tax=Ectopseudomonas oleovorans TaxID=301 RepID=A0A379JU31_ECTOL|nr:hypothetical protein PSOLE_23000 [Pseudomonas oleovorans subsp. oleovorans]SEI55341.1 hypothetical protein SAMN05216280_100180 [Pseudomonas oleovorans]SUD51834.1 Uncharacterised protein [Pseudomonas oleovorans]